MARFSSEDLEPQEDNAHEQLLLEQAAAEISLQTAYEACRRLCENAPAINDKLHLRVEQLALAIQGCVKCSAMLGDRHANLCSFRGQRVEPSDLDSRLRQPEPIKAF